MMTTSMDVAAEVVEDRSSAVSVVEASEAAVASAVAVSEAVWAEAVEPVHVSKCLRYGMKRL